MQPQAKMGTDLCKVLRLIGAWVLLWDSRAGHENRLNHICCEAVAKAQTGSFESCREPPPTCVIKAPDGTLEAAIEYDMVMQQGMVEQTLYIYMCVKLAQVSSRMTDWFKTFMV